jgi:AIPR protein
VDSETSRDSRRSSGSVPLFPSTPSPNCEFVSGLVLPARVLLAIRQQHGSSIAMRGKGTAMNFDDLKRSTDWFQVHSLRQIADPSERIDRRELVVSLDQYPQDFGLGPNPREPEPKSRVAKAIRETLEENGADFHLLNRGITIIAKKLIFDNKTDRVRLFLHETEEEEKHYGILDGGNTNKQINDWRFRLADDTAVDDLRKRFVNIQVLVPRGETDQFEELLNDIKEARNTSIQVSAKSLADARQHFALLQKVLANEPYFGEISWHEGDKGSIDVLQIAILLMVVYPKFSEDAPDGEPNGAYGRKEKCLREYLDYADRENESLQQYIQFVPDLLRLFDEIQYSFPDYIGGRFGGMTEVRIYDAAKYEKGSKKYRKTPSKTMFLSRDMIYEYPTGWVYPIFAGLRILLGPDESGKVSWKRDPLAFWKSHGEKICSQFAVHLKGAAADRSRIATSATVYSAMRAVVRECYTAEILAEHGISV